MAAPASSSSASLPPASMVVDNFINMMTCPCDSNLLLQAVSLFPCMHKVNEQGAKLLYTGIDAQNAVIKPGPCPLCNVRVTAYYTDHLVRSLAQALLGPQSQQLLPQASKAIQNEQKEVPNISFPGLGARFMATTAWEAISYCNFPGVILEKQIRFVSKTPNSLFSKFSILGNKDKSLRILVTTPEEHRETAYKYLEALGITLEGYSKFSGDFMVQGHEDLKIIFKIIAENNEIPAEHFQLIRTLVEQGYH